MICPVCGVRRQMRTTSVIAVPMEITIDYRDNVRKAFPVGTRICDNEMRKLSFDSTSEGQRIQFVKGRWSREDGKDVFDYGHAS